jgi:hypothetical protein
MGETAASRVEAAGLGRTVVIEHLNLDRLDAELLGPSTAPYR